MDARVRTAIEELSRRGFAKLGGVVADSLVGRLQRVAQRMSARPSEPWSGASDWFIDGEWRPSHFREEGESANYYDCLGVDPEFEESVEELLRTASIRDLLDEVVGPDRRLWFVQLRWALPGAPEYPVHQDVFGELGLCLYLSDHPDEAGSMVLRPGSHRWPRLLEAFPLMLPAGHGSGLEGVDGVAGDLCVFFNKTWHGRTSARDAARLVMLISFLPPGPEEVPRRLPPSARESLGPELLRVTAPEAGRPFERPPEEPHLSSVFEVPENCPFSDEVARVCRDYAWRWSTEAGSTGGAEPSELEALRRLGLFTREAMLASVVPAEVADELLDEFAERASALGYSARSGHHLRMEVALWRGNLEAAERERALRDELPRDALCEPPGAERAVQAQLHADRGELEQALGVARALFDLAEEVPAPAWSRVLLPLVAAGEEGLAARAHAAGLPGVRGNPLHLPAIGRHLEYLALRSRPDEGLALLDEHLGVFAMQHDPASLWHFWAGAWSLVARLERAGVSTLDARVPRVGLHHRTSELAGTFRDRVGRLSRRLDERHGNRFRAGLQAEVERRVEWPLASRR